MALSTDTVGTAVQETADGTLVGRNTDSKVGFFGATPVVRGAAWDISTGTVAELAAILAAYGLITTQA
jgi:hypothetical protein